MSEDGQLRKPRTVRALIIILAITALLCGALLIMIAPNILVAQVRPEWGDESIWGFKNLYSGDQFALMAIGCELKGISVGDYTICLGSIQLESPQGEYEINYDEDTGHITLGEQSFPTNGNGFSFHTFKGSARIVTWD